MKALSQFVVHCFDLIEAEGSALRTAVRGEGRPAHSAATSLVLASGVLLAAVALCGAGIWLMSAGLMWWLQTQVSRPLAAFLTGLVILALGTACLVYFRMLAARRNP